MYQVEMINLGRSDANITQDFEQLNYNNLRSMVEPHLVSSDISFHVDEDIDGVRTGTVYAGFRPVGKMKITDLNKAGD